MSKTPYNQYNAAKSSEDELKVLAESGKVFNRALLRKTSATLLATFINGTSLSSKTWSANDDKNSLEDKALRVWRLLYEAPKLPKTNV